MDLYGFESLNLMKEARFLLLNRTGLPDHMVQQYLPGPPTPAATGGITNTTVSQDTTTPAGGGSEGMEFLENMGTGLLVAGLFGGASALSQNSANRALTGIAETNAGLWESVSQSNRETLKTITETNTAASTGMTRWQVMGMIFNANTQYLQSVQITTNMDRANRRAFFTERKQMYGESKMMTLAHNATIHADNLDQDRQMTKMEYDFRERIAAATTTTTG